MPRPRLTFIRDPLRAPPRGIALVEMGLILPVILVLILGLTDLGLAWWEMMRVQAAAAAGAQFAAEHEFDPADLTNVKNAVKYATPNHDITAAPDPEQKCYCAGSSGALVEHALPCTGTCPDAGASPGIYVVVYARLVYHPLLPVPWLTDPVTLTGRAYRRID